MAFIKSIKKFLKTPACGCTKKNKKSTKRSRGKRSGKRSSKRFRGGYITVNGVTLKSPHVKSPQSKSRSKSRSRSNSVSSGQNA